MSTQPAHLCSPVLPLQLQGSIWRKGLVHVQAVTPEDLCEPPAHSRLNLEIVETATGFIRTIDRYPKSLSDRVENPTGALGQDSSDGLFSCLK